MVAVPMRMDGSPLAPAGNNTGPLNVPPVDNKFKEAAPVRDAVITPALKLPDPSLATTLDAVLVEVASTAIFTSFVSVLIIMNPAFSNVRKFKVVPVTFRNTLPVPVPTLAPAIATGAENSTKPSGSIPITAFGVLQTHEDPD